MSDLLFWGLVGAFIGWNVPQPFWARWMQEWVMDKLSGFKKTDENK